MENNQFPEQNLQPQAPVNEAPAAPQAPVYETYEAPVAPQAPVNEAPQPQVQQQPVGTEEIERQPNFGPQPPMGPQPMDAPASYYQPIPAQPQQANAQQFVNQQQGMPVPPPAPGAYPPPPPVPGQPIPGAYPPPAPKPSRGLAIASLVLGICSLVFCWSPFLALIAGIVGLILGIVAKKKEQGGMAMGGIITSAIGLAISVVIIVIAIVAVVGALGSLSYYW